MKKILSTALIFVFFVIIGAQTIVDDGNPAAEIVIGKNAHRTERFAAQELQLWLKNITGATLNIITTPKKSNCIFIGRTFAEDFFKADLEKLTGNDGFAIRGKNGNLYIFGSIPKGTLNGIYAFLEYNTDIIWARPQAFGVNFTPLKTLVIKQNNIIELPVSGLRGWQLCGYPWDRESELWNARMRCSRAPSYVTRKEAYERALDCGMRIVINTGHSLRFYMPKALFQTHPEYFCLISGKRREDVGKFQVCFSNLAGADTMAEEVVKSARSSKYEFTAIGVCIQDNWNLCECQNCKAPIILPNGRKITAADDNFHSTRFFIYLNRIAEVMSRECPDKIVQTFAYFFTIQAPAVKLADNMEVVFCPAVKNDKYSILSSKNKLWLDRLNEWSKITENFIWREYYGCGSRFPRPLAEAAAEDMKTLKERFGFNNYIAELLPDITNNAGDFQKNWDVSGMEFWVLSKLYWNPYADVSKLRDEYLAKTYGKAAQEMKKFYELIRNSWYNDPSPSTLSDNHYKSAVYYIVEKGLEEPCRNALAQAEKQADKPNILTNIKRTRECFEDWMKNKASYASSNLSVPYVADAANAINPEAAQWHKAAVIDGFRVMGRPKEASKSETRVRVMHDRKQLYILFECNTEKKDPLYSKGASDSVEGFPYGDHVEIFLGSGVKQTYYHFAVDFANAGYDAHGYDKSWNSSWKSHTGINHSNRNYWVIAVISFKDIQIDTDTFLASFYRMVYYNENKRPESSSWGGAPVHQPSGFGKIILEK